MINYDKPMDLGVAYFQYPFKTTVVEQQPFLQTQCGDVKQRISMTRLPSTQHLEVKHIF